MLLLISDRQAACRCGWYVTPTKLKSGQDTWSASADHMAKCKEA